MLAEINIGEAVFKMSPRSDGGGSKGSYNRGEASFDRFRNLGGYLSPEERRALRELERSERPGSSNKSLTDRTIVCLECGRPYKALKRHLALAHGMTPHAYRTRWKLPPDYPMVAPLHSRKRRFLAKQLGLGHAARRNAPKRKGKRSTPQG